MTNALLLIITLVGATIVLSLVKQRWPGAAKVMDDKPPVIVEQGRLLTDCMAKARVDEEDVLEATRAAFGIERLEQVRYAVLEQTGDISIIPERSKLT